jgi:hypothetical protein
VRSSRTTKRVIAPMYQSGLISWAGVFTQSEPIGDISKKTRGRRERSSGKLIADFDQVTAMAADAFPFPALGQQTRRAVSWLTRADGRTSRQKSVGMPQNGLYQSHFRVSGPVFWKITMVLRESLFEKLLASVRRERFRSRFDRSRTSEFRIR